MFLYGDFIKLRDADFPKIVLINGCSATSIRSNKARFSFMDIVLSKLRLFIYLFIYQSNTLGIHILLLTSRHTYDRRIYY